MRVSLELDEWRPGKWKGVIESCGEVEYLDSLCDEGVLAADDV